MDMSDISATLDRQMALDNGCKISTAIATAGIFGVLLGTALKSQRSISDVSNSSSFIGLNGGGGLLNGIGSLFL
jgi:hypothetical protein